MEQFAINAEQIHLANTRGGGFSDIELRSTGGKSQHDLLVHHTNMKFSDSDIIMTNGDIHAGKIKNTSGADCITLGDSTIDFHNKTAQNLALGVGSIAASTVASSNGFASIDAELDHIETNKLEKGGHTASKLLATSAGGFVVSSGISSTLPTTNQSNISTNTTNIATNTGNITTNANNITANENSINSVDAKADSNFADIGTNSSAITTNANNITANENSITTVDAKTDSNFASISTNSSNITTLDGAVAKTADNETITGNYTFAGDMKIKSTSTTYTTKLVSTNGGSDNELILPSSNGTLALQSSVTQNSSDIATKLPLAGGTLTGDLQGTNLGLGVAPSYNLHIRDTSEDFIVNHNTGFTPDGYFLGTTTSTPLYIGSNDLVRMTVASSGEVGIGTYPASGYKLDVLGDTIRFKGVNAYGHSIILDRGDAYWSLISSSHHWDCFNDSTNKYTRAATNTGQEMFLNYYSDGDVFCCSGGGTLKHKGISNVSDDRLKHNEVDISEALNTVMQLKPQKYFKTPNPYEVDNNFAQDASGNYVDSSGNIVKGKMEAGLIAQDLLETDLAWLVGGGGTIKKTDLSENIVEVEEMYNVNYDGLHAYTIKAIQEQQSIITMLHKNIMELKQKLVDEETKSAYFEMKLNQIISHLNI